MEDLSRSIHMAEAGDQGEGMLFGLTEEQVSGEVRRTRRDVSGRFEVVTDMETPDFEVPESQFEVPKEEQAARQKAMRATIERRAVNKHTEIFRQSVTQRTHDQALSADGPVYSFLLLLASSLLCCCDSVRWRRSSLLWPRLASLRSWLWTISFARFSTAIRIVAIALWPSSKCWCSHRWT